MNKNRRAEIRGIIDDLEDIKLKLDIIKAEEEEYLDDIPDNLQESQNYTLSKEAIDNISSSIDDINDGIESLYESI